MTKDKLRWRNTIGPVVSYSDARKVVMIVGWRVLLPGGEFTREDLGQIGDVVERATNRLMERRGTLKYIPGHE